MIIAIYAGGIPFNGDTIKNQSLGGSESAAYYVAKELATRGHRVSLFTETREQGRFDGVEYIYTGEKSQGHPLGANWHWWCERTPHDVNIVQRVPIAFYFANQAKINLWWAHDIALRRNNDAFMGGLWQTSRVIPVSNWFKEQISKTWLINPNRITPVHNGVDYSLFEACSLKDNSLAYSGEAAPITMLYCSRPERGLENLVMPDGIMEQLLEKAPHIRLKVCGYEHPVEQLEGYYAMLRDRVDKLPNCEHLGALTKADLYRLMCEEADVWCYPTEFEEVSCITAMEVMAAGMSIFTTPTAALPETIGDYQNCVMIPNTEEGVDIQRFVERLSTFNNRFRRRPRRDFTWQKATDEIEAVINDCFEEATENKDALARHYLRHSDIFALKDLESRHQISSEVMDEVKELYEPWMNDLKKYADHYADGTEEMYDGPNFRYEENFESHPRFLQIGNIISSLAPESVVYDYGCAHGHFTNNLAKQFPELTFVGVDISPKAIEVAAAKGAEWGLSNVNYVVDDWLDPARNDGERLVTRVDAIILGEILEHVPDPADFLRTVQKIVGNCPVIITTPFGPWEEMSYKKEWPKRFHLHHFERGDLCDLFGHHKNFSVTCLNAGHSAWGEAIGWYITQFDFENDVEPAGTIDYKRKHLQQRPRQTVSFCGIVKDGQYDLPRMLRSIEPVVDEIIIGVDDSTSDGTRSIITAFAADAESRHRSPRLRVTQLDIPSPVVTGFDAARNTVLSFAKCDWVMWADADEEFIGSDSMAKFLRPNTWEGYGISQHHFSVEPTGVLSTDYPVRLFRRNPDVRFLGVVHEHPENINNPNEGVGFAWVNREMHFSHVGYSTENVRRKRFERNVSLMARDRKENPDRILGMFLWIRDLALMNKFDLEQTGGQITPQMQERALIGLELWEIAIDKYGSSPQVKRMVRDHLEFYDVLTNCMDHGFTFRIKWASGPGVNAPHLEEVPAISARFLNKRHLDKFLSVLINDEVQGYEDRYL